MEKLNVAIADDNEKMVEVLGQIIEEDKDLELVGKAHNGGIVQGLSGSPVIQNGKIIGAVTHVFVQDASSGYGIFIENMLKNTERLF